VLAAVRPESELIVTAHPSVESWRPVEESAVQRDKDRACGVGCSGALWVFTLQGDAETEDQRGHHVGMRLVRALRPEVLVFTASSFYDGGYDAWMLLWSKSNLDT